MLFLIVYLIGSFLSSLLIVLINKSINVSTTVGELLSAFCLSWLFIIGGILIYIGYFLKKLW